MADWKKVITESDNATHKNQSITLTQLFAGLDASSAAGANQVLKANANHDALVWADDDDVTSLGALTDVTSGLGISNGGALVVGNGSGNYVAIVPTGDVAMSSAGALTISSDKIKNGMISDSQIDSDHYVDGSIDTAHIADDQVTYAKMQDTSTNNRVLGAGTAGTIAEVQVATDMIADDAVTGAKLANNIDIAGTLDVTSTATFDADVAILGKLTMTGDIDTVSVTDLDVADKTITLASSSTTYSDQATMLTATNGSGISLQNQYTSGSVATTNANMSASLTWDKDAGLSGWKAKDYTDVSAVPIALMDFKGDTGAPANSTNSGGVGSFILNTHDDELYVRVG